MTISNLVPLMKHKYGIAALKLFSPSAVERMEGCRWDPQSGTVIGQFDEEISYLDEDDPMQSYIKSLPSKSTPTTTTNSTAAETSTVDQLQTKHITTSSLLHEMDDDSVSTLGNNTHHRWIVNPPSQPHPLTQRPIPHTPTDDASTGSISTLTTRLTTMEAQYNQISGAVQDIKTMLAGLAQATNHSNKDEPPTNVPTAGRGPPSTGGGS